jgi:hypothetical protein
MYESWTFESNQEVYGICPHPGDFGTFQRYLNSAIQTEII